MRIVQENRVRPYAVSRFDSATSAGGPMDEIPIQLEHTLERPGKPLAITRDEHQWASLLTLEHIFWPPNGIELGEC